MFQKDTANAGQLSLDGKTQAITFPLSFYMAQSFGNICAFQVEGGKPCRAGALCSPGRAHKGEGVCSLGCSGELTSGWDV